MKHNKPTETTPEAPAEPAAEVQPDPRDTQISELTAHAQRLQAEFDNYRKRVDADVKNAAERGQEKLIRELLTVFDSVELATKHSKPSKSPTPAEAELRTGLGLIRDQFMQLIERFGIETISCEGLVDPRLHEVYVTETNTSVAPNSILEVLQNGYARGGVVLRTAKVKAARNTQ